MHRRAVSTLKRLGLYTAARAAYDSLGRRRRDAGLLGLYAQFVRPEDLCFDVGANVGNHTALLLELGARVVAVEPQAQCFRSLERRYGADPRVELVGDAVGARPGTAEMFLSDAHTISSMSAGWMQSVKESGRFGAHTWDAQVTVPLTTLDALIEAYGEPRFCKIDVEGYEAEVLAGLSRPLAAVTFEFTPEFVDGALACVRRLAELGPSLFNFSSGASGELALASWVGDEEIVRALRSLPRDAAFGDVYARPTTLRP
jgi:FkbM family methyltransferase